MKEKEDESDGKPMMLDRLKRLAKAWRVGCVCVRCFCVIVVVSQAGWTWQDPCTANRDAAGALQQQRHSL